MLHGNEFLTTSASVSEVAISTVDASPLPHSPEAVHLEKRVHGDLYVEIAGPRQHVGYHIGDKLGGAVWNALNNLCPRENVGKDAPCDMKKTKIDDVCYDDDGKEACNSHLEVTVKNVFFKKDDKVRTALMDAIATTARKQSEQDKNCFWREFSNKKESLVAKWKMCNIGQMFTVLVSGGNRIQGRLDVDIRFNSKTKDGPFDCPASVQPVREGLESSVAGKFSEAFGVPFFDTFVQCRPDIKGEW